MQRNASVPRPEAPADHRMQTRNHVVNLLTVTLTVVYVVSNGVIEAALRSRTVCV